jgi:hypothetical protein
VIIIHNRIRGMESMEKEIGEIIKNSQLKIKNEKDKKSKMGVRGEGTVKNFQQKISSGDENQILMSEANSERAPLRAALEVPLGYCLPLETFDTFGHKSMGNGL